MLPEPGFNFLHRPLSELYVVFNDRHDTSGQLLERALVVKLTRSGKHVLRR